MLLEHPGGVLQRHLPAAELGELRPESDVPVVEGRLLQGHARQVTAATPALVPGDGLAWPAVTTYTLRKGSPAKTRTDLVVDRRRQDRARATSSPARGRRTSRSLRPQVQAAAQLAGLHAARPARCCGCRRAARSRPASCWSVGLGDRDAAHRSSRYAAPPASPPATSATPRRSRWPCPPPTPSTCAPWPTGSCSAATPSSGYKSALGRRRVAEVAILSDAARRQDAIDGAGRPRRSLAGVADLARDWVNTPPNDLTPAMFADGVLRARARTRGARSPG